LIERIRRDELLGRDELGIAAVRSGPENPANPAESAASNNSTTKWWSWTWALIASGARQSEDDRADDHQHAFVDAVAHRAAPERTGDEEG